MLLGNTLHSLLSIPASPTRSTNRPLADVALFTVYLDDAATGLRGDSPRACRPTSSRGTSAGCASSGTGRYASRPTASGIAADDYAEQFRPLFDEAVADRLRTDRVGCQLSGGMDSTSVAVTAHQRLQAAGGPSICGRTRSSIAR